MLANFHTHSVFCDGDNTPEEIVLAARDMGFSAIGFSGHGYTPFDTRYCMTDTDGYIAEINRLKEKYGVEIQVYLGAEEDAFSPTDREKFDYIIGSSHYLYIGGKYLPIDSSYDYFKKCLAAFNNDSLRLAEHYYSTFCDYIKGRRPDIIGHFDLITKYEEMDNTLFLNNAEYNKIAEKYISIAADSGCIFEVNTGAMARGLKTRPYPTENLLRVLLQKDAPIILSSDSHSAATLDFAFEETKQLLCDIGFRHAYTINDGKFVRYHIK